MKTVVSYRFLVPLGICALTTYLVATAPNTRGSSYHHPAVWYVMVAVSFHSTCNALLFVWQGMSRRKVHSSAIFWFFFWAVPPVGLFAVASLMEGDTDARIWQGATDILVIISIVAAMICSTILMVIVLKERTGQPSQDGL